MMKPLAAIVVVLALFQLYCRPAEAQLIVVTKVYRVVAIDAPHNRIVVSNAEGNDSAGNVLVGPDTKLYVFDREIPNFSWHLLQKGMKITVKGGMTWDFKVKAKQIYI